MFSLNKCLTDKNNSLSERNDYELKSKMKDVENYLE